LVNKNNNEKSKYLVLNYFLEKMNDILKFKRFKENEKLYLETHLNINNFIINLFSLIEIKNVYNLIRDNFIGFKFTNEVEASIILDLIKKFNSFDKSKFLELNTTSSQLKNSQCSFLIKLIIIGFEYGMKFNQDFKKPLFSLVEKHYENNQLFLPLFFLIVNNIQNYIDEKDLESKLSYTSLIISLQDTNYIFESLKKDKKIILKLLKLHSIIFDFFLETSNLQKIKLKFENENKKLEKYLIDMISKMLKFYNNFMNFFINLETKSEIKLNVLNFNEVSEHFNSNENDFLIANYSKLILIFQNLINSKADRIDFLMLENFESQEKCNEFQKLLTVFLLNIDNIIIPYLTDYFTSNFQNPYWKWIYGSLSHIFSKFIVIAPIIKEKAELNILKKKQSSMRILKRSNLSNQEISDILEKNNKNREILESINKIIETLKISLMDVYKNELVEFCKNSSLKEENMDQEKDLIIDLDRNEVVEAKLYRLIDTLLITENVNKIFNEQFFLTYR
jgi:hypothetical protein